LKSFDLDVILSQFIKSVEPVEGSKGAFESTFKINYVDGAIWTCRVVELSELHHTIAYEVIETTPVT